MSVSLQQCFTLNTRVYIVFSGNLNQSDIFFLPFTTSLKGNSLTKLHLQVLPALAVVCRSSGGHLVVPWLRLGCGEPSSRSPFQEKTPVPLLIGHPGCQLPPRLCVGGRGRLPVWDRLPYIE